MELKETFGVTQIAVSFICEKICSILRIDRESHKKKIINSIHEHDKHFVMHGETNIIFNCESPFKRPFERFSNGSVLRKYVASKSEYVAPVELELGIDPYTNSKDTMQYIPINKTLEHVLNHEDVLGEVLSPA